MRFWKQAALVLGVFIAVTALAELLGAANLGTAMGIASIAFSIALVTVLLKG